MNQINYEVIGVVLGRLCSPKDTDYEKLMKINSNDEFEVKEVIRTWVVPYFQGFDYKSQEIIKLTLRYALTVNDAPLSEIFDRKDIPFSPPEETKDFYFWLWDELFDEKYEGIENIYQYHVTDDLDVVYKLHRAKE